jgi:hypothetical protein
MRRNPEWVFALLPWLVLRALLPLGTMVSLADGAAGIVLCSADSTGRTGQPADRFHSGSAGHAAWQCPCPCGAGLALPPAVTAISAPAPMVAGLVRAAASFPLAWRRWQLPVARGPPHAGL